MLCVCPVYLPIGGLSARAVFPLLLVAFFPSYFFKKSIFLLLFGATYLLLGFVSSQTDPDIRRLVSPPLFMLYFAGVFTLFVRFGSGFVTDLYSVGRFLVILSLVVPITTIIFRFAPGLEASYMDSGVASIFVNSNNIAKYALGGTNIQQSAKAGGYLFANGNWSATFCFVLLCCSQIFFFRSSSIAKLAFAVVFLLGVLASGSKTPFFLLPLVVAVEVGIRTTSKGSRPVIVLFRLLMIALVVFITMVLFERVLYALSGVNTFVTRVELWQLSLSGLSDYWLLGGGVDYWDNRVVDNGGVRYYRVSIPPHNFFLATIMVSGVFPLSCLILFVFHRIRETFYVRTRGHTKFSTVSSAWVLAAVTWVMLHSMLSNITIFGDYAIAIPLALLLALTHTEHARLYTER